jgi:hypothetical protein
MRKRKGVKEIVPGVENVSVTPVTIDETDLLTRDDSTTTSYKRLFFNVPNEPRSVPQRTRKINRLVTKIWDACQIPWRISFIIPGGSC